MLVKNKETNYQCCLAENENLLIDATAEKGGSGLGIRPHELLEAALASCMNISLRKSAESLGVNLKNVETYVRVNRELEGKTIFEYGYTILDDMDVTIKNKIAEVLNNAPVRKTLSRQIEFREIGEEQT